MMIIHVSQVILRNSDLTYGIYLSQLTTFSNRKYIRIVRPTYP